MLRSLSADQWRGNWPAVVCRSLFWGVAVASWLLLLLGLTVSARALTTVRISTTLGDIDVTLYDNTTPVTAANFLNYVNTNAYEDMFFHRSVPGFVVQGGGFTFTPGAGVGNVPTNPPIVNEFNVSNSRGTIAMAKLGGDPDSATSQWFFNLADNVAGSLNDLDNQNGGFTVFAKVVGDGMDVVDAIAALNRVNAGGAFTSLPFRNEIVDNTITENNLIFVESITTLNVLAGDYNGNGQVEQGDLDLVLQNWGQTASQASTGLYGHGPGQVAQGSLDAVLQNWGVSAAPDFTGSAVPEPAAALLLGVVGLSQIRRQAPFRIS